MIRKASQQRHLHLWWQENIALASSYVADPEGKDVAEPEAGITKALPQLTYYASQVPSPTSQLFQNSTTV